MSTTSTYAAALKRILSDLTYYIDLSTYIFGTMGCIGNLIAFSSRQMRRSSAALYLISATVSQLVTILVCVGFRLFYDHSSSNLMNESIVFCKFRYYLAVALPALASYFMSLATFDRFLCASNNAELRAWCQPKIAKRFIMIMVLVGIIIPIHIPIQFNIYNNLCQTSPGSAYIFIYGGYLILVVIFLPHILMFVFSLITLMIMRKSRKRVIPELTVTGNNLPNHRRKLELKLIKVILVSRINLQVVFLCFNFRSLSCKYF